MAKEENNMKIVRKRLVYHGRVQGVGFRYTAYRLAKANGLTGWVRNERNGTVTMEVQGTVLGIQRLMKSLNRDSYIRVDSIDATNLAVVKGEKAFETLY